MKYIHTIFFSFFLLLSCTERQASEKNTRINQTMQSLFNTQNIEITTGKAIGTNNSGSFISVTVDDCKKIDNDTSVNMEMALSTMATATYEILKDYTSDTSYSIDVSIIRTIDGKDLTYEMQFPYLKAQKMLINLITFNHYMELIKNQKFSESFDLFGKEFKSNISMEKYIQTMKDWFGNNGEIKQQEFLGFTFNHIEAFESEYDVMIANGLIFSNNVGKMQLLFKNSSEDDMILGINL